MRILSQEGFVLASLDKCNSITSEGSTVFANFLNEFRVLGRYASEERAKEVLFEIAQHKESLYVMPEV